MSDNRSPSMVDCRMPPHHSAVLIFTLLALLSIAIVDLTCDTSGIVGFGVAGFPGSLDPFDPSAYDMSMTSEERAWRAAHQPGGEISYCCCYCGRGGGGGGGGDDTNTGEYDSSNELDGIPAGDVWLYKSRAVQPRPEIGDPVDRLAQRRRRRQQRHGKDYDSIKDEPYGPIATNGLSQFLLFRTVRSRCDNEYCIDQSSLCEKNHLWTGWAGAMTSSELPPFEIVRDRCEKVYRQEMDVLDHFNHILDGAVGQQRIRTTATA